MVLRWEGKVFAAADTDADAADTAETDWKHEFTPERGELMTTCNIVSGPLHIFQSRQLFKFGASGWWSYGLAQYIPWNMHFCGLFRFIITSSF